MTLYISTSNSSSQLVSVIKFGITSMTALLSLDSERIFLMPVLGFFNYNLFPLKYVVGESINFFRTGFL